MVWIVHKVFTYFLNCIVFSSCLPFVVSDFENPILTKIHLICRVILSISLGNGVDTILYFTLRLKPGLMLVKIAFKSHLSYGK